MINHREFPAYESPMNQLIHILTTLFLLSFAYSNTQPNIVVILADDLGYGSLGCYGNQQARTPHIDKLAANGIKFTDFHSNGALCTPTRAALMTGRYQQRCAWVADSELSPLFREQRKKNPVQRWAWGISTEEITIPKLLHAVGYQTAIIGKWHLGYDEKFHPLNFGFTNFRGFIGGGVDYHTHVATHGKQQLDWWKDRKIENETGYTTDLLSKHAKEFIVHHKARPFFLYIAHATPHSPWQVRQINAGKADAIRYQEMIETLDESVGVIISTLREHQLEENTLVIFCSDNGPQGPRAFPANGVLQGKKGSLLEAGHRVPCIASWPGKIPRGITSSVSAMTMDFLPTFANLASATIPKNHLIDGVDLLPTLTKQSPTPERTLHWKHGDAWALRKGPWKAIGKNTTVTMLFDLSSDIAEKKNLLNDHPTIASELLILHQKWVKQPGFQ